MKRIVAYRFSAFGDVAMVAPVLKEFLSQNSDVEVIMVSKQSYSEIFEGIPRLIFEGIDVDEYKGLIDIAKLSAFLEKKYQPHYIADLHDVIRTKILSFVYKLKGNKVHILDKGREEKIHLIDIQNIDKHPLRSTVERYADVFRSMGFPLTLSHQLTTKNGKKSGIGLAPFAQHKGKVLPLEECFQVAKSLAKLDKVYFFGGGADEIDILSEWESQIDNTQNLAGKLTLKEELEQISSLQLMISMDSANMHLASLVGTRCLSVWGSTHYYAGFLGYGQSINDVVHVKDLTCRPCSIYGDKECYRGDWACLNELHSEQIINKVKEIVLPKEQIRQSN